VQIQRGLFWEQSAEQILTSLASGTGDLYIMAGHTHELAKLFDSS
jgi:hypothetical protein